MIKMLFFTSSSHFDAGHVRYFGSIQIGINNESIKIFCILLPGDH